MGGSYTWRKNSLEELGIESSGKCSNLALLGTGIILCSSQSSRPKRILEYLVSGGYYAKNQGMKGW